MNFLPLSILLCLVVLKYLWCCVIEPSFVTWFEHKFFPTLLWSCTCGSASDPVYKTVWKTVLWASLFWSSGKCWINHYTPCTWERLLSATWPTEMGRLAPFSGWIAVERLCQLMAMVWCWHGHPPPYITWRFHRSTLNEWALTNFIANIIIHHETLFRFPLRSCNNVSVHWLSDCLSEVWMKLV